MHPNRIFDWSDRQAMLAFLAETAFATIVVLAPEGAKIVHAPVLVTGPDRLHFHISRRNVAAAAADGTRALLSCLGGHFYVSPDWYGTPDQVPTWNYVVVECEGSLRRLEEAELIALLDGLSHVQEAALAPKRPWTRDKMAPGGFDAMVQAILGYELRIDMLRGSRKLGQNKSAAEIAGVCAALRRRGHGDMAALMEAEGA